METWDGIYSSWSSRHNNRDTCSKKCSPVRQLCCEFRVTESPDCFFFFFLRTEEKQHLPCYTIWKKTKINFKQRLVPTEMQPKNCEITKRLSFCGILYLFRKILCKKKNAFFHSKWQYICVTVYFFSCVLALSLRFPDHFQVNVFFLLSQVTLTWLTQP